MRGLSARPLTNKSSLQTGGSEKYAERPCSCDVSTPVANCQIRRSLLRAILRRINTQDCHRLAELPSGARW
jgi:hypothetical protein